MELEPSTLAGVITACATVLTAMALLVTAIAALRKTWTLTAKVDEVHTLVNQRATDTAAQLERLTAALIAAHVAVPKDPSLQ